MTAFDPETAAFLESGCALIIGTIDSSGGPCASRGWGLTLLSDPRHVRLLLGSADAATIGTVAAGAPIAITAGSVRTLRSVQLKGRTTGVETATDDDEARAARYCAEMFTDIHETDFTPMELLERLRPASYVACTVIVDEVFNQTPGPNAGAPMGSG